MKSLIPGMLIAILLFSCKNDRADKIIAVGQMPNITMDKMGIVHLVFGSGDSLLYSYSTDHGKTFSAPVLISSIPKLAASHMRGPQVASTTDGLTVTACDQTGDIFSFVKDRAGIWSK